MTFSNDGRRGFGRAARLLVAAFVLVLAVVGASPVRAQEQPPPSNGGASGPTGIVESWAVSPGDGTAATAGRANLAYELAPGTEVDDQITVYNLSNVGKTLALYSTDAFNTSDGAFSFLPGDQKPSDVGTWVQLPVNGVSLPGGQQTTMPIKIKVPPDARPGDHVGVIVASSPAQGTSPDGRVVNVDRRTGTRVYVRVAGPLQPKLSVENLGVSYAPKLNPLSGDASVHYKIVNRGNIRLGGTYTLTVSGPFGLFGKSQPEQTIAELLPGQSIDVNTTVTGIPATVVVSANVAVHPQPVGGDTVAVVSGSAKAYTFAVPILLVALIAIAILVRYARRRYKEHDDEGTVAEETKEVELV